MVFNQEFVRNGWFYVPPTINLNPINVPLHAIVLRGDKTCDMQANVDIFSSLSTAGTLVTHYNHYSTENVIMGNSDSQWITLQGLLFDNASEDIAGDCTAADFDTWAL